MGSSYVGCLLHVLTAANLFNRMRSVQGVGTQLCWLGTQLCWTGTQLCWISTGSHFCNLLFHEDSRVLAYALCWWVCAFCDVATAPLSCNTQAAAHPAARYHIPGYLNLHSVTVRSSSNLVFCFSFQTSLALKIMNLHLVRKKKKKKKKKVRNKECVVSYADAHARFSKLSVHVVWEDRGGNVTNCVMLSSTVVPDLCAAYPWGATVYVHESIGNNK